MALSTQHDGDVTWVYQETEDGKTVNAAAKGNLLDLLVKGIDAQESESHLGIEIYFEN
jgi:hypothetical protein